MPYDIIWMKNNIYLVAIEWLYTHTHTLVDYSYSNPSQIYYIKNHNVDSSYYFPQLFWNKASISIIALSNTPILKDDHFTISNKDYKALKPCPKYFTASKIFINHQFQNQNNLLKW